MYGGQRRQTPSRKRPEVFFVYLSRGHVGARNALEDIRLPPQMWAFHSVGVDGLASDKCVSCYENSRISYLNPTSPAQSVSTTLRPVSVPFSGTCASQLATTSLPSSCTETLPQSLSGQKMLTENGSSTGPCFKFPCAFPSFVQPLPGRFASISYERSNVSRSIVASPFVWYQRELYGAQHVATRKEHSRGPGPPRSGASRGPSGRRPLPRP
jgi:hypothetical protein